MAAKYTVKAPKSGREIKVYEKSFRIDGEATTFFLKAPVPHDIILMLQDMLDDVYQQGRNDKAKQIRQALCPED